MSLEPVPSETVVRDQVLTFVVDGAHYGIDVDYVTEIVGVQPVTRLPDVPHYVRGVMNLRGLLLPVVDARARFARPERAWDARTCVVVLTVDEATVGLVVDAVAEVLSVPHADRSAAQVAQSASAGFVAALTKLGDGVRILLDPRRLLDRSIQPSLTTSPS